MPVTLTSPTEILKAEAVSALMRCCSTSWLEAFTPTCNDCAIISVTVHAVQAQACRPANLNGPLQQFLHAQ